MSDIPSPIIDIVKKLERYEKEPEKWMEIAKQLKELDEKCHSEVMNGNLEHMPMNAVRFEFNREIYHICRQCISKYLMEHPELAVNEDILIMRGKLTDECQAFLREYAEKNTGGKER